VSENDNGSAADGQSPEVIGVRRGMFGARGSGDTSGYGRLVRPVALPGSSPRPYGGYFDEVVGTLAAALGEDGYAASIERVVVYRDNDAGGPARRYHRGLVLRDDATLRFELCLGVKGALPRRQRARAARRLPLMSITHNRRIRRRSPHPTRTPHSVSVRGVSDSRLA
jgi:NADH-quinone oxidoreductase subunit C